MYKISKKYLDILEAYDFKVTLESDGYLFSRYSSRDQDFNFFIPYKPTKSDFVETILEYYEDYDVSEEAALWVDQFGHGKNGAPHDLEDIINDMKECEGFIYEVYEILSNIKKLPYVVKKERHFCVFLVDGVISTAEYTFVITSEEEEKALRAILNREYRGKELFFVPVESAVRISSRNILPDNDLGFTLTDAETNTIAVKAKDGWLVSEVGGNPEYPGVYTTFYPFDYDFEDEITLPCVLVEENPHGELNAFIWDNPDTEDYTIKVPFENPAKAGEKK